ncbi:hypothetical protein [Methylophaga sp.]|uniref:hypothetical protein n=1 Tax=Methylophaga sp. TaxID=2024840 RepID=UPI003A92BFA2
MSILSSFLGWFQDWSLPWYWLTISTILFFLGLLGSSPIRLGTGQDVTFFQTIKSKLKQLFLFAFVVVGFLLPIAVWSAGLTLNKGNSSAFTEAFLQFMWEGYKTVWEMPIIGFTFGFVIAVFYARFVVPRISALKRRFIVRQSSDELSDIRAEENTIGTKNYKPQKHYKKGFIFFGLGENDKPIYEPLDLWRSRHIRLVGPTQTGKGVEIGLQLDQSIRNGDTVFFIDPKPDKHAKAIMKKAAQETGRNFVECDLNPDGRGKYAPFYGGADRDIRARLMTVLGLRDGGSDADFYKSTERQIIDTLSGKWDGQLSTLKELLTANPYIEDLTKRSLNYINEWLSISTFSPDINKGRSGLDIERCLKENAVVYIRGNLDDDVINMACTVLLMELVQEVKRLADVKKGHTFIAVDEVAFLINEKIADALATVAGFDTNILLAYQAEGDLLNLKDRTLNARAIASRVKVNCKYALYYMAQDFETATVMADDSGTIQKAVTRAQRVNIGSALEEQWDNARDIHRVEENLITANRARMLPERVGVLYRPAKNAVMCFTCWIDIDLAIWGDKAEDKQRGSKRDKFTAQADSKPKADKSKKTKSEAKQVKQEGKPDKPKKASGKQVDISEGLASNEAKQDDEPKPDNEERGEGKPVEQGNSQDTEKEKSPIIKIDDF